MDSCCSLLKRSFLQWSSSLPRHCCYQPQTSQAEWLACFSQGMLLFSSHNCQASHIYNNSNSSSSSNSHKEWLRRWDKHLPKANSPIKPDHSLCHKANSKVKVLQACQVLATCLEDRLYPDYLRIYYRDVKMLSIQGLYSVEVGHPFGALDLQFALRNFRVILTLEIGSLRCSFALQRFSCVSQSCVSRLWACKYFCMMIWSIDH